MAHNGKALAAGCALCTTAKRLPEVRKTIKCSKYILHRSLRQCYVIRLWRGCSNTNKMENQIENVLKLLGKHVLIHMEHNTGPGGFIDCSDLLKIISLAICENRGQSFEETFKYCPSAEPYSQKFNKLINEQVQKVDEI